MIPDCSLNLVQQCLMGLRDQEQRHRYRSEGDVRQMAFILNGVAHACLPESHRTQIEMSSDQYSSRDMKVKVDHVIFRDTEPIILHSSLLPPQI
jgi:hypothetical protein